LVANNDVCACISCSLCGAVCTSIVDDHDLEFGTGNKSFEPRTQRTHGLADAFGFPKRRNDDAEPERPWGHRQLSPTTEVGP
jgi:hypothetical protein